MMLIEREQPLDEAEINATVERFQLEPDMILTYGHYNSGYFFGNRERNPERLTSLDLEIMRLAESVILDHGQFRGLMFGGMVGTEGVKLAYHGVKRFGLEKFRMIITNLESDFTIERGIAEAGRRLEIFGSWERWQQMVKRLDRKDPRYDVIYFHQPLLPTWEEIAFLEQNHHLVEYLNPLDGKQLRQGLRQRGIESVHWIEESYGALYDRQHDDTICTVLGECGLVLDREWGVLMTTTPIQYLCPTTYQEAGFWAQGGEAQQPYYEYTWHFKGNRGYEAWPKRA